MEHEVVNAHRHVVRVHRALADRAVGLRLLDGQHGYLLVGVSRRSEGPSRARVPPLATGNSDGMRPSSRRVLSVASRRGAAQPIGISLRPHPLDGSNRRQYRRKRPRWRDPEAVRRGRRSRSGAPLTWAGRDRGDGPDDLRLPGLHRTTGDLPRHGERGLADLSRGRRARRGGGCAYGRRASRVHRVPDDGGTRPRRAACAGAAARTADGRGDAPRARGAGAARQPTGGARVDPRLARLGPRGRRPALRDLVPRLDPAAPDEEAHAHGAAARAATERPGAEVERRQQYAVLLVVDRAYARAARERAVERDGVGVVAQDARAVLLHDRAGREEAGRALVVAVIERPRPEADGGLVGHVLLRRARLRMAPAAAGKGKSGSGRRGGPPHDDERTAAARSVSRRSLSAAARQKKNPSAKNITSRSTRNISPPPYCWSRSTLSPCSCARSPYQGYACVRIRMNAIPRNMPATRIPIR